MDISQREQAKIFLRNVRMFLKEGGIGLLAVKARSISVKGRASEICEAVRDEIGSEFMVTEFRDLEPHEVDHYMIAIKKKAPAVNPNKGKNSSGKKKGSFRDSGNRDSSKNRSSSFRSFEKNKSDSGNKREKNSSRGSRDGKRR